MPIQLCVGLQAGRLEAVFNDGSAGEYEARARNRRSAETNNRKPISSLSRRFLVGVNATETNFMKACRLGAEDTSFRRGNQPRDSQELRGRSLRVPRKDARARMIMPWPSETGRGKEDEELKGNR